LPAGNLGHHVRRDDIGFVIGGFYRYDVAPDGQRILAPALPMRNAAQPLTLVQNWMSALSKK